MRFSDWSSDVCSSELVERARECLGLAFDFGDVRRRQAVRWDRAGAVDRMDPGFLDMLKHARNHNIGAVAQGIDIDLDRIAQITVDQIGRASCRERVCQYV